MGYFISIVEALRILMFVLCIISAIATFVSFIAFADNVSNNKRIIYIFLILALTLASIGVLLPTKYYLCSNNDNYKKYGVCSQDNYSFYLGGKRSDEI